MLKLKLCLFALCLLLTSCNKNTANNFENALGEQWTVINYWATWCKPCIEEIPELNQLASNNRDKVTVLGVDFDQSQGDALQEKINKLGISFNVIQQEPAEILGYARPNVLPTTVIINAQQQVHRILVGPQTQQTILDAINTESAH
mgnify:CR=1 FL=1